jgi:phage baseplate assembly protein gpV
MQKHDAAPESFSGATLRGRTEIEGELIINGIPYTPESFRQGTGSNLLTMSSGTTVDLEELTVKNALLVLGDVTIEGMAAFRSDVSIDGNLTLSGSLTLSGTLTLSRDQAGFAFIPQGGTGVTVKFNAPMIGESVVTITPQGPLRTFWWVENSTQTGFTITVDATLEKSILFSWHAFPVNASKTAQGTGVTLLQYIPFPVDAAGYPLSSNTVWNTCIRNQVQLDNEGKPYSCSRYHTDNTWTHPDLFIEFLLRPELDPMLVLPEGFSPEVQSDEGTIVEQQSGEAEELPEQSITVIEHVAPDPEAVYEIDIAPDAALPQANPIEQESAPVEETTETIPSTDSMGSTPSIPDAVPALETEPVIEQQ